MVWIFQEISIRDLVCVCVVLVHVTDGGGRMFCMIFQAHVSWVGSVLLCTDISCTISHNGRLEELDHRYLQRSIDCDLSDLSVRRVKF